MKKGFTIIELLVTLVIIALIGGIGVVAYNSIFDSSSKNYYKTVEQSLLLSGTEFFEKNRDELPIKGYNMVSLRDLERGNYVAPVKDTKGNACEEGEVYVTRDPNTRQYEYEVCLKCSNYESEGAFCNGYVPGTINVNAHLEKNSNQKYNPLLSYKKVEVINDDNLIVKLTLQDENLSYFKIDKINNPCKASNNSCEVKIENSGSYLVSAYNKDNVKIADDRVINVKIDREGPTFSLENDKRYVITDGTDKRNVTIKLGNVKDDMGIKKVTYCIKLGNTACNDIDFKELANNSYIINESLGSGSYHIEVKVEDIVGNITPKSSEFDVSYYVKLRFPDKSEKDFEVIKEKNYGYLDNLPNGYNNKLIEWVIEGTNTKVSDIDTVSRDKTHTLVADFTDKVAIPTNSYCKDVVYNGKVQKLTKDDPVGVTFYNNTGMDAKSYTVKAKIISGYIWKDGTTTDKEFTCVIDKADNPISVTTPQTWNTTFSTSAQNKTITAATNNQGTVSYAIISQKSGNTTVDEFRISGTTLYMEASTDAKTYSLTIRATAAGNSNYNSGYKDIALTVKVGKATVACSTSKGNYTYAGTIGSPSVSSNPGSGTVTYYRNTSNSTSGGTAWSGTTSTTLNAGTYYMYATIAETTNYKGATCTTGSFKVNKATPDFIVTESTKSINYGLSDTFGAYAKTVGGVVSATSSNSGVVSVTEVKPNSIGVTDGTPHNNEAVIYLKGEGAESATVTVKFDPNDSDNYNSVTKTVSVTINKVAASLSCSDKEYTGTEITGCTCTGGTVGGTYKATNTGTYTASCTPDNNHTAPSNASWKIKGYAVLTCSNHNYTGSEIIGCSCSGGTVGGDYKATNTGTYTASCTADADHLTPANQSWSITKKKPVCVESGTACNGTLAGHAGWGDTCNSCYASNCGAVCSGQTPYDVCCKYS